MSDTRRHCDPEKLWGPGVPRFDRLFPHIKTRKHQERDQNSKRNLGGKRGKFINGVRNTKYNLKRKIEKLMFKEEVSCE